MLDEAGKLDALSRMTAFSNTDAGRSQITVQAGDTLQAIAQRVYGNSNLWYVIAEANALGGDADLVAGASLTVPEVKTSSNDASTFKPYNPGEITGPTTPSLPYIPPPSGGGCGTLGMIIMAVVIVVVTVYTAGAASAATSAAMTGATQAGASTAFASAATSTAAASLTTTGAITAGAIGGAAGAATGVAAGTALGSMMGVASFSWRGVASAAVSGAVSGGFAGYAGAAGISDSARAVGSAFAGAAGSYAGQAAAGLDASFSWRSVAISAVTSVMAAKIAPAVADTLDITSDFGQDLAYGFSGGMVSSALRASSGETLHQSDYATVLADAFGNALGGALSAAPSRPEPDLAAATGSIADRLDEGLSLRVQQRIDADTDELVELLLGNAGDLDAEMAREQQMLRRELGRAQLAQQRLQDAESSLNAGDLTTRGVYASRSSGTIFNSENGLEIEIIGGRPESLPALPAMTATGNQNVAQAVVDGVVNTFVGAADEVVDTPLRIADMVRAGAAVAVNLTRKEGDYWLPAMYSQMVRDYDASGQTWNQFALERNPLYAGTVGLGTALGNAAGAAVAEGNYLPLASLGGEVAGGVAIGAGMKRYGSYGVTIEDIGASGLARSQAGSVGVRFGKVANSPTLSQTAMRERVLANIAESQSARAASNIGGGLVTDAVAIPDHTLRRLLQGRGLPSNVIGEVRASFDGQVFARHGLQGDQLLITETATGRASGIYVTRGSAGATPDIRRQVLALPPSNSALVENPVFLARPQILLEGVVAPQPTFGPYATGGGWQVVTDGGFRTGALSRGW